MSVRFYDPGVASRCIAIVDGIFEVYYNFFVDEGWSPGREVILLDDL